VIGQIVGLVAVVGALMTLAVIAIQATRRAGDEKARRSELAVRVESVTAKNNDLAQRLKDEKERGDALDDLIAELAIAGPVDGEFKRLLQRWATQRPDDRPGIVHPPASPASPGSDDLLRPGE
jgi:hypothetical protein